MAYNAGHAYQQPHDTYAHSNASQYDQQYQQGGYSGYGAQTPQSEGYYGKEAGAGAGAYGAGAPGTGVNPAKNNASKYSYAPSKKGKSKWIKYGIPAAILAILIIAGAVLGGIFGSRAANSGSSSGSSSGGSTFSGTEATTRQANLPDSVVSAASSAASAGGKDALTYQGTDPYGNPSFLSTANTAAPSLGSEVDTCTDSNPPSGTLSADALRSHPRIMTSQAEWDCLPGKIAKDAYLTAWNYTIFQNASNWYSQAPVNYSIDGTFSGSGILDPARDVQQRVRAWAYAYRMTNDTKWLDRTWTELQTAAGNNSDVPWNAQAAEPNAGLLSNATWNPSHFLDTAELTAAFAIGYDWLYDAWDTTKRDAIMWSILNLGLLQGLVQYDTTVGWWRSTNGNWNCVCNSGMILGALAIWENDPTGYAQRIIDAAVPNIKQGCMTAVYPDGTWSETANYWYFGSNAQARASSALISATGNDQGMADMNQYWNNTGLFHMYVGGQSGLFAYGDNGPNKFSTNANGMFLWAKQYNIPQYALYQRDRADAADPLSMFWYDTGATGGFWNGMLLDRNFNNDLGAWASMRSSWTDSTGTYIGIKASNATGHQAHGDLDAGDFVIDALGTRWAGEYGNGNYLSYQYFQAETDDAIRWQYYRKGTQGQNTLVINDENQAANCKPVNTFDSTYPAQSASLDYVPGVNDVAYFKTDLSTCYNITSRGVVQRGIRFLNGRRQILVQDEISSSSSINSVEWRVQTNASVSISSDGKNATLTISKLTDLNAWGNTADPLEVSFDSPLKLVVSIVSGSGTFTTNGPPATRLYGTEPSQSANTFGTEDADQTNTGVTTLRIQWPSDSGTLTTWWQPQYDNLAAADQVAPKQVGLSSWSLTSHNA